MDREEYERRQREIAEFAASEGATYFDPESPVIWKRYIIGPVARWRRVLWWFFPPSDAKMHRIMQRRSDRIWKDASGHLTGSRAPTGKDAARVISLGLALPVAFSLVGPIYYGYTHDPYWRIIIWASACIVLFLWQARSPFRHALSTAFDYRVPSLIAGNCCGDRHWLFCWRYARLFDCSFALSTGVVHHSKIGLRCRSWVIQRRCAMSALGPVRPLKRTSDAAK